MHCSIYRRQKTQTHDLGGSFTATEQHLMKITIVMKKRMKVNKTRDASWQLIRLDYDGIFAGINPTLLSEKAVYCQSLF